MNIWKYFRSNPEKIFLNFTPINSHWRIVSWNFDMETGLKRKMAYEVHYPDFVSAVHWETSESIKLRAFKNQKCSHEIKLNSPNEFIPHMNLAIHSLLKFSLEANYAVIRSPVSGATTQDMQNELKGLQWIQASFTVLTKALSQVSNNKDLILSGACYSGIVPQTNENVLRLIIFNLDIFYYFREDQSLQVVVYDDRNFGHGESKVPAFMQIIKVTKPQFYDEIIKLLQLVASVGELR